MTKQTRRKFSPEFKAKVAIEALKEQLTLAHLSEKFEVNPVTISKMKTKFFLGHFFAVFHIVILNIFQYNRNFTHCRFNQI